MTSEAQRRAQEKYDRENTQQIVLKLNKTTDADVLEKLAGSGNRQGYIKSLVRSDLRCESGVLPLDSIKCLLLPVVKKYGINSLGVFGSYARNEAGPDSDVDILIDSGNYSGLFEYYEMLEAMKASLGREVDVVTRSSLENCRSEADLIFKNNVEKDIKMLI